MRRDEMAGGIRTLRSNWLWPLFGVALTSGAVGYLILRYLSPALMNADVIMNTIMSLQNLTVFYWGQDRLLNLLPALVSGVHDPAWNLQCVALLPVVFLMTALALMAFVLNEVLSGGARAFFLTHALLAAVFFTGLTGVGVFEIAIWHVEYTFPLLAMLLSCYGVWGRYRGRLFFGASLSLLFLAAGVNPALIIPVAFAASLGCMREGRVRIRLLVLLVWVVLSVLAWGLVSRAMGEGGGAYSRFDLARIAGGSVGALISSSLANINYLGCMVLAGVLAAAGVFPERLVGRRGGGKFVEAPDLRRERWLVSGLLLFAVAWILVFLASEWVERNQFHWRYFIWPYFAVSACVAVTFRRVILERKLVGSACLVVVVVAAVCLGRLSWPDGRGDYAVLAKAEADGISADGLYAGDYWRVWPSVMHAMRMGEGAYGMAFRWVGNGVALREHLEATLVQKGSADVLCLGASQEECMQQIRSVRLDLRLKDVQKLHGDVRLLRVERDSGAYVIEDLSPELIRGIRLEPRLEAGGRLLVTIRNASQSVFPSTTMLGPIRLSWRVIGPGVSPETVGWDTRLEVNTVIQPGASSDVLLDPGLPSGVRTGRIEVSLVQEGVRWLHSAGMAVGVVDLGAVR